MELPETNTRPSVRVLIPPALFAELCDPAVEARLRAVADDIGVPERVATSEALVDLVAGFDAVLTGWQVPPFTAAVLDAAPSLRLIAHAAGSIKHLLPPIVFERGVAVTHAAAAIAPSVAETCLLLTLLCLRPVHVYDRRLHAGAPWAEVARLPLPSELAAQRVGVIGAGYTGCQFIERLRPFGCEIVVYDPYLSAERARELGVVRAELDDLLRACGIVAVHAPVTPETHHLLGARELALLRDGAALINTARAWVIDQPALLAELRSGRIRGALDVFDPEPLPDESPLRQLDNVILTPHIAGASVQARRRQGQIAVDEIARFFTGETLRYRVTGDMLATMA